MQVTFSQIKHLGLLCNKLYVPGRVPIKSCVNVFIFSAAGGRYSVPVIKPDVFDRLLLHLHYKPHRFSAFSLPCCAIRYSFPSCFLTSFSPDFGKKRTHQKGYLLNGDVLFNYKVSSSENIRLSNISSAIYKPQNLNLFLFLIYSVK